LRFASLFADEGANVAICARNADDVGSAANSLAARGLKAWGKAGDVADPAALKAWVEAAAGELGGIDSLVCNVSAHPGADSPVREVTGFQSECFDSNFRKRPAGFDSFVRGHQGRNDCRSLGRISFGHEKD
jgi:3-oxoacyl-[acyl-carrier protein] reductase